VIPAPGPHLEAVAETHPGETGKNNEDRHFIGGYQVGTEKTPVTLAVVADGIGGHLAGEVAAQLVVDTFRSQIAGYEQGDPIEHLRQAVVEAGRAVARAAQDVPEREGMGSTLSAAWFIGSRLYTATVGDSRIYLMQNGRLTQVSIDHTWVQEAVDLKVIPPEAARSHPHAHVLRRHLGSRLDVDPDLRLRLDSAESDEESVANQGHQLVPGDQILICTDGLTDLVQDHEIVSLLRKRSPQSAVHSLVDLSRSRGGFDNITAILLTVPGRPRRRRADAWLRLLIAAGLSSLLLVFLVLAAVAGAWWFGLGPFQSPTPTIVVPSVTSPVVLTSAPSLTPTPSVTPTQTITPTDTPTPEASSTPAFEASATLPEPTTG
jgi:protein phosphatase